MQPKITLPSVTDSITWGTPLPNFMSDAEIFLKKFEQQCAKDEAHIDFKVKPDPKLNLSETA
jgi:hypothetical protein